MDTPVLSRTAQTQSKHGILFELHPAPLEPEGLDDVARLPYRPTARQRSAAALSISEDDGMVWVKVGGQSAGALEIVAAREPGAIGLAVVRRQYSAFLAMRSLRDDVYVNGLPALRFAMLTSQDSILLAGPRRLFYVTERFVPWVGPPPAHVVGKERCPVCGNVFEADTQVVSSYCSALVHWETADSHPHLPADERLNCMEQARVCGLCRREFTTKEHLVWDPITI